MKNTGQPTQDRFEAIWTRLGSEAFCYRVVDAAEVRGRTGKIGMTREAPSDFIVTYQGLTFYAEAKSCHNKTSFPFGQLEKGQKTAGLRVTKAGGAYLIFIEKLPDKIWFMVPYSVILSWPRKSMTWAELETYRWTPPTCST